MQYFLFEYEQSLLSDSRQSKVTWEDLLKNSHDKISIEHIFPQNPVAGWQPFFSKIKPIDYPLYHGSLGNLLLLSQSINSALQNDVFANKKQPKYAKDRKIRNGYSDGSHSEIEVSQYREWTAETIKHRGMKLLDFMEKRWDFKFKDEQTKENLLFPKKNDN